MSAHKLPNSMHPINTTNSYLLLRDKASGGKQTNVKEKTIFTAIYAETVTDSSTKDVMAKSCLHRSPAVSIFSKRLPTHYLLHYLCRISSRLRSQRYLLRIPGVDHKRTGPCPTHTGCRTPPCDGGTPRDANVTIRRRGHAGGGISLRHGKAKGLVQRCSVRRCGRLRLELLQAHRRRLRRHGQIAQGGRSDGSWLRKEDLRVKIAYAALKLHCHTYNRNSYSVGRLMGQK